MVNVLFASGVIRTPYRFMHSIEDMFNNKNVKKIVLTVWKNEIDKYKNLRNFLKERNVIIIELDEPLTKTTGYIDHQMISLKEGISIFDNNEYIFKTRCDLYIDPVFFNDLVSSKTKWNNIPNDEFSIFDNSSIDPVTS